MSQAAQARLIEQAPINRQQVLIITLCGAALFMDGFDAQAMGYVAPALGPQLHIARQALGPVFSSGLGGALPNAIALTAEYVPKRFRATAVMAMFCGFSIGAAVGGFVAAGLISRYGWQSVFVAGGITPLLVALLLIVLLPESSEFRGTRHGTGLVATQLFAAGRARMTILFWIIFFMSLLDLYFLNNWLPTVIHDTGIAVERAIVLTALFQVGGTVGALALGRIIDRYLSLRVLAWTYLGAALCVMLIGVAGRSVSLLACAISAAGFLVVGGQSGANALAAVYYPTQLRSAGVGWALGIGRVGSVVGPLLGGVLVALELPASRLLLAASVPVLLASGAAFLAGRGGFDEDRSV